MKLATLFVLFATYLSAYPQVKDASKFDCNSALTGTVHSSVVPLLKLNSKALTTAVLNLYKYNMVYFEDQKVQPGNLFTQGDQSTTNPIPSTEATLVYFSSAKDFLARAPQYDLWGPQQGDEWDVFQKAWGKHKVSIIGVQNPYNEIESINGLPEWDTRSQSPKVIRIEDWLMLSEFSGRLRLRDTKVIRVNSQGEVLEVKSKLDFLLDRYPGSDVILTRTMSNEEKLMWNNINTPKASFGSELMRDLLQQAFGKGGRETQEKHMSLAAGAYWNDSIEWWQANVELKLSKDLIRSWFHQGKIYVTALGYQFDEHNRLWVDPSVTVPFELATIDSEVNKQLQKIYLASKDDLDVRKFRQEAERRTHLHFPLALFEYSFSATYPPFQGFFRGDYIWQQFKYDRQKYRNDIDLIILMNDDKQKQQALYEFVGMFLQEIAPQIRSEIKAQEAKGRVFFSPKVMPSLNQLETWYKQFNQSIK